MSLMYYIQCYIICVININNNNSTFMIPTYVYHSFLYFCLKKTRVGFNGISNYDFIIKCGNIYYH